MHSNQYRSHFDSLRTILFFSTMPFPGFIWVALVPVGAISEIVLPRNSNSGSAACDIVDCKRRWASYEVWVKDIHWLLGLSWCPLLGHGLVFKQSRVVGMLSSLVHRERVLPHNQDLTSAGLQKSRIKPSLVPPTNKKQKNKIKEGHLVESCPHNLNVLLQMIIIQS